MTDLVGVAAIIAAVSAAAKSWHDGRRAARRDAAAAQERADDREEAKVGRASAATKLDDIAYKVDGAHTALIAKVDSLRSDKVALSDALLARDEPGALSVNESPGPVTIDKARDVVHIEGGERRQ